MIYRATLKSAIGLYAAGAAVALLLAAAGLLSRPVHPGPFIAGAAVFVWLIAIRFRCRVRVSPEELATRSLMGESRAKWREIIHVRPAFKSGYWTGRLLGPSVLEFESVRSRFRINFKLFPFECLREVMRYIPPAAMRGIEE